MRLTLRTGVGILFLTFFTVLVMGIFNMQLQISKLNDYHYAAVHELESSDFSLVVQQKVKDNGIYDIRIENRSLKDDMRIYQVTTSKHIIMPILGFDREYKKESVARWLCIHLIIV